MTCEQCDGRGLVKLQEPGKPWTAYMARCELCSGMSAFQMHHMRHRVRNGQDHRVPSVSID